MSDRQLQLAVFEFENEVRTIVRRGSSSREFDSPIKEVAAHYCEIIQEQLDRGAIIQEAEIIARKRFGMPLNVALQILSTPQRATRGYRIQLWFLIALFFSTCQALGFSILAMREPNWGHFYGFYVESVVFHLTAALIYGYGVFLSNKILWKPLVVTTLINFVGTAIAMKAFESNLIAFAERSNSRLFLASNWYISSSYQLTLSIVATFLGTATISFLIGRIWLLRSSWFQLSRK